MKWTLLFGTPLIAGLLAWYNHTPVKATENVQPRAESQLEQKLTHVSSDILKQIPNYHGRSGLCAQRAREASRDMFGLVYQNVGRDGFAGDYPLVNPETWNAKKSTTDWKQHVGNGYLVGVKIPSKNKGRGNFNHMVMVLGLNDYDEILILNPTWKKNNKHKHQFVPERAKDYFKHGRKPMSVMEPKYGRRS